jgi:hypothetical protein
VTRPAGPPGTMGNRAHPVHGCSQRIGDRIRNCNAKGRCARRRGRVNVIRCRARERYGGVVCLRALKDRLLSRLRRRLLVVGQRPHGRGQQCTVRDIQHDVLGRQRRVEQPDRSHLAVQNAAQCTRADPYPLPRDVRTGEEQHQAGEHVGQGLLRGNAEKAAARRPAVVSRYRSRAPQNLDPGTARLHLHRGERMWPSRWLLYTL